MSKQKLIKEILMDLLDGVLSIVNIVKLSQNKSNCNRFTDYEYTEGECSDFKKCLYYSESKLSSESIVANSCYLAGSDSFVPVFSSSGYQALFIILIILNTSVKIFKGVFLFRVEYPYNQSMKERILLMRMA